MKYYSRILFFAAALTGLASCAMEEVKEFPVDRPANLAEYEYLDSYEVLKNYVDRSKSPDFKLGAGVTASEFVKHGQEYLTAVSNFDEVTPGNAMKFASVVGDNGNMNFDNVTTFVDDARKAGLTVYGHTLAWHAQQNKKFLNSLIADRIDPNYETEYIEQEITEACTCLKVRAKDMVEQAWDSQFWLVFSDVLKEGDSWEIKMDIMAEKPAAPGTQTHKAPGEYIHWAAIGNPSFTTEWTTYEASGTASAEMVGGYSFAFNLNDFQEANTYYFDNISLKINGVEQIKNGNCDDPTGVENYVAKVYGENGNNPGPAEIVDKITRTILVEKPNTQFVKENCILVESEDMAANPWDTQFWIVFDDAFQTGDSWEISMDVMAAKDASSGTQTHIGPGGYIHWAAIGTVNFTTEWNTYTASGTASAEMNGGNAIAFNLNDFQPANKYYFDNISFKVNGKEQIVNGSCDDPTATKNFIAKEYGKGGQIVEATIVDGYTVELPGGRTPLTPEEKKDTLTKAMDKWIKGMMEATAGKVSAWDAVNEAISGADFDGDGKYDLQSAETASEADQKNNFYWQDYLGSVDYVRLVVSKARQYYTEFGGTEPLRLFINDYNLESWWDGNKKLKSLIEWIKIWEEDGTKIDGIGTQMHVSLILNADQQKQQEDAIVNMFKLLADSGKLVKISELDMGVVNEAFGPAIPTSEVTEEQHHKMEKFYEFIVSKYLEIIPAAQQYGITQWCTVDSPASSGWRASEPVGLWDANHNRKHTYAGFAEGLQGAK